MKVMPFNQRRKVTETDPYSNLHYCAINCIQKHNQARYEYGDNIVKGTKQLAQNISFNVH